MNRPAPPRIAGFSMVDLMIGMVISVLTVAAMLSVYKVLVSTAVPAARIAKREAQAHATLVTAGMELQQAGYGLESTEGVPKVALFDSDKRIVWSYRQTLGGAITCSGLKIDVSGIHVLLPKGCAHSNDGTTFQTRLIADASVLAEADAAEEARPYTLSTAKFALGTKAGCGPYGVSGSSSTSQIVELKDGATVILAHCLSNL